jgi:hypothetical protein
MSTRYLVTAKSCREGEVISLKGASMNHREVQEALGRLKKTYMSQNSGWIVEHWVENRSGKVLVDFEMEAIRDERIYPDLGPDGADVRFLVSLVLDEHPIRRYR